MQFSTGKDDEHACSIFVNFLAEAVGNDIKSTLVLANFFAGVMD